MIFEKVNFHPVLNSLKFFKLNSMFYKIFFTTMTVILVLGLTNILFIKYILNMVIQKEMTNNEIYLDYNCSYIDSVINEIKNNIVNLEYDSDVITLSGIQEQDYWNAEKYVYYKEVTNISKKLRVIKSTIKEISNIYIYLPNISRIIDPFGINDVNDYFSSRYDNPDLLVNALNDKYFYSINVFGYGIKKDDTSCTSKVNIIHSIQSRLYLTGTIVVNINDGFLKKILEDKFFSSGRKIFMINGKNQNILTDDYYVIDDDIEMLDINLNDFNAAVNRNYIHKGKYFVSFRKSEIKGIYYMIYTSRDVILSSIDSFVNISNILICTVSVLSLIISIFLSQYFYYPISNLVNDMKLLNVIPNDNKIRQDEINYIKDNLIKITSKNISLENTVIESKAFITKIVLYKLLFENNKASDVLTICKQFELKFLEGLYIVAVIKVFDISIDEPHNEFDTIDFYSQVECLLDKNILGMVKTSENEQVIVMYLGVCSETFNFHKILPIR
jgi:hypothetical protein